MMINKRLIASVPQSRKYIAAHVGLQWLSLAANIGMMASIAGFAQKLLSGAANMRHLMFALSLSAAALLVRLLCALACARLSHLSSRTVKSTLRRNIYEKLLRLGPSCVHRAASSSIVQVAVEGVDQLENYFGAYLPQFFYAMLAPLTLFCVLVGVDGLSAGVLLVCVPLIPVAIAAVQTWAKKLLSRYWGQYTALGDTFLENLQGLTTLKIYRTDGLRHERMNRESEAFRRITMKVLTMQLNSITIMDLIAYGGAALGMILAVLRFAKGAVDLPGALLIILLCADFFLPMRLLGSYFHIAMNGMAASDKIFALLDLEEEPKGNQEPQSMDILLDHVDFAYEADRWVLRNVTMEFPQGSCTAIVGESGCGKSTVAALIAGAIQAQQGCVSLGGIPVENVREQARMRAITRVSHAAYLFSGTVRDNLLMGKPDACEAELWAVLEQVRLADFLRTQQGLDTPLAEQAGNLSGGQRQRLAMARALLHDSPIYIFDEATSNIDVESENDIMEQIRALAGKKTVILISHRLANCVGADRIYVMDQGRVVQVGSHASLWAVPGVYCDLYAAQQDLERFVERQVQA